MLDDCRFETGWIIENFKIELLSRRYGDGYGVRGPPNGADVTNAQATELFDQRIMCRIVFKYKNGVEQQRAARYPAPGMDLCERGVVILLYFDGFILDFLKPFEK